MAKKSVRFGVSDEQQLCSASWKLWTETAGENSEVYLACRELDGELKASLHQSGQWHIAFSNQAYKEHVEGSIPSLKNRFTDKWPRPTEIADGYTLAFRIVTPSPSVTSSRILGKNKKVIWIPKPPDSRATEIDIIITKQHVNISGWPGKSSMGTSLIGSFQLNNGDTIWVVYWVIDIPDLSKSVKGSGHFFRGKSKDDLKNDTLRALAFGSENDGSRVIYDLVVQQVTS